MKSSIIPICTLSLLICASISLAHDTHNHDHTTIQIAAATEQTTNENATSGQGKYRFKVLHTSKLLPEAAREVLNNAHGGFAVDRRDGKGEIYFSLPGAGIIQISSDLGSAKMINTDEAVKSTNQHNTTIWYDGVGIPHLIFPANGDGKVFTTDLQGTLLDTLIPPTKDVEFGQEAVNDYFQGDGKFVPTDVEYLENKYYITTGYSPLDYVLTANVQQDPIKTEWNELAFGGKGEGEGQFQTGHGITISNDGETLDIADRPLSEIDQYTSDGEYQNTITLPEGSWPCDIDHMGDIAVIPCLHGPDRDKGAPIYVFKDGEVVSTIMPKEDLGLGKFQHIHNAVITKKDDKFYIIAQSWNPGDFAILEQVVD